MSFTERFLRAQISFEQPAEYRDESQDGNGPRRGPSGPTKRFNAMGVLEDFMPDESESDSNGGEDSVTDIGPSEQPGSRKTTARAEPVITGAGRVRSLNAAQNTGASVVRCATYSGVLTNKSSGMSVSICSRSFAA